MQNPSSADLTGAMTFEDILGKDVYDTQNAFIGVSNNVYIKPSTMEILGLAVDKGFFGKGLAIGSGYIREITDHAIFLSIRPSFQMRGMEVFDRAGKYLGKVHEVELDGKKNNVATISVKRSLFHKKINVPASAIKNVGDSVFLSKRKSELEQ